MLSRSRHHRMAGVPSEGCERGSMGHVDVPARTEGPWERSRVAEGSGRRPESGHRTRLASPARCRVTCPRSSACTGPGTTTSRTSTSTCRCGGRSRWSACPGRARRRWPSEPCTRRVMQRFLESLSTYSRRRLTQAQRPDVDRIDHLPPALALRQRPPIPGPRSTVGTMSDVLNVLRLMMSRLGSHLCPNGHRVGPSIADLRRGDRLPGVRRAFRAPQRRVLLLQLLRRLPSVPGPGRTVRSGHHHPGSRSR